MFFAARPLVVESEAEVGINIFAGALCMCLMMYAVQLKEKWAGPRSKEHPAIGASWAWLFGEAYQPEHISGSLDLWLKSPTTAAAAE